MARETSTMNWRERITVDPDVLAGKPVVRGTRLSVVFIVGLLAEVWTDAQLLANYPTLSADEIRACLAYAVEILRDETTYPMPA
jgi:uncharacterized protein (DUF433 family)